MSFLANQKLIDFGQIDFFKKSENWRTKNFKESAVNAEFASSKRIPAFCNIDFFLEKELIFFASREYSFAS